MTKKLIIILSTAAMILTSLFLYQKWQRKIPEIVSFSPLDNSVEIAPNTQIEVAFHSAVKTEDLSFQITPEAVFQTMLSKDRLTVIFAPEELLFYNTTYSIQIVDRPSKQVLSRWFFTTIKGQGDSQLREEIDELQAVNYPLSPFSPPDNSLFYFIYTGPRQIKVFLKGDAETAQQEAINWIQSKEIDPATHQIEWVTPGL